jgi:Fe-S oxidoreductase
MGEVGLFEMLYEENTKLFSEYRIKTLFTSSPHCFNTFVNEYPPFAFNVEHYTTVITSLFDDKKIEVKKPFEKKIVFHDPCFLGKQNDIYDAPREILKKIPGISLLEFERSRERSLCCEGGGGRMWVESESEKERLAVIRVKEACDLGVEIIATACPFCLLTLEDAVKTSNLEEKITVMDVIEILDLTMHGVPEVRSQVTEEEKQKTEENKK